ncbi:MAG: fibronectin type III domain-containing protein [Nitrospirae bacterium]|nr:fibronectin type III domain-containing protein [Nitrospirota bacterium]
MNTNQITKGENMNAKRTILSVAALVVGLIFVLTGIVSAGEALRAVALNSAIEASGAKWQAGETPLSSLTDQQRQGRLGLIKPALTGHEKLAPLTPLALGATLPSSLDWRNNSGNWVTSVKDQGNCGSCWAFATTAALESYTLKKGNTPGKDNNTPYSLDLSEQVMVSCSGAGSCNGGYIDQASTFLHSTGEPVESCYAYTATNGSCSSACATRTSAADTINSWQWVTTSASAANVDTLRNALNTYGPLVVTMNVYYDFFYYNSGIYSYVSGAYEGGHAILLVGYNDDQKYFIVKNSWGSSWGEKGYFRIAYSEVSSVTQFGAYTIAYPQQGISLTPSSLALTTGASGTVTVSGGQAPYSATSASTQIATASVSGTTVTITGVAAGTTSITVKDSIGSSANVSVVVSVATVPGAPTITAVSAGNGQVTVSFSAPSSNGGSSITKYTVTSSPDNVTATGTASPITVTGLKNGTAYTFTVKATNAIGTGAASAPSNSITPGTVPGAPTGVTATAGNAQATVSFTAPSSNGGSSITGYTVISSRDNLTASGTASPITISGLTNGTSYTFTVKATNSIGTGAASSASNSITPAASVPGAPTGVTATAGNARATIFFTAPSSNGVSAITGYTVISSRDNLTASGTASPITISGLTNGTAYTFTVKATNAIGTGAASSASNSVTPSAANSSNIVAISGGALHSVALKGDGTVWGWGFNFYGQLGNGTNTYSYSTPVQVSSLTGVTAISAGFLHTAALKSDGTVWTWGWNNSGELGNGTTTASNTPVQVSSLTGVTAIAAGSYYTLALKSDGTVWAWGFNHYGQLGNGANTPSNKPVQVSSLTGVTAIAAGTYHAIALKSDGTAWAWGFNHYGQLGNGANTPSNKPVQVSGLTGATAIAAGLLHTVALKSDGTVLAWGSDANGALGNGSYTADSNKPVQLTSLTGATAIAAGYLHTIALKSDGTVYAWGYNGEGELGNSSNTGSNKPVQASSLSGVTAIAGGAFHSIGLKSDGTIWDWGYNNYGELGNGANTDSNKPVQVIFQQTSATYTVTPSAGANGTISPATTQSVSSGKTIQFTVTPNTGYTASVSGTCSGTLSGNTYTTSAITANCTVNATFTAVTYIVYPSAGDNGTISPATPTTVNAGKTISFTLTPQTGYYASAGGGCNGTLSGNVYTTSPINANCTVTAYFYRNIYTVTPSAGANGSISPATPQSVVGDHTMQFTVTPYAGYTASVSGCGGSLSGNLYTTGKITANCAVTATFTKK